MRFLILPLALALCMAPAFAAEETGGGSAAGGLACKCDAFSAKLEPKADMDPAAAQLRQQTMIEKFDANKDGSLNAEETEAAQWEATKTALLRCQEMRDQFDADDDGKLTEAEEAEFNKFAEGNAELKAMICECAPIESKPVETSASETSLQETPAPDSSSLDTATQEQPKPRVEPETASESTTY